MEKRLYNSATTNNFAQFVLCLNALEILPDCEDTIMRIIDHCNHNNNKVIFLVTLLEYCSENSVNWHRYIYNPVTYLMHVYYGLDDHNFIMNKKLRRFIFNYWVEKNGLISNLDKLIRCDFDYLGSNKQAIIDIDNFTYIVFNNLKIHWFNIPEMKTYYIFKDTYYFLIKLLDKFMLFDVLSLNELIHLQQVKASLRTNMHDVFNITLLPFHEYV